MVFFTNAQDTVIAAIHEPLYQGSSRANTLTLVAPYPPESVVTVAFRLPNGILTTPQLAGDGSEYRMTPVDLSSLGIRSAENGARYNAWVYTVKMPITQYAGTLKVNFFISSGGETHSVSAENLPIHEGVPYIDPTITETDINGIAAYLNAMNVAVSKAELYESLAQAYANGTKKGAQAVISNSDQTITSFDPEKFLKKTGSVPGEYKFLYDEQGGSWDLLFNGALMERGTNTEDYGIAYTGTPVDGNEITVTVTDSVPVAEGETGYQDNAKYYSDLAKAEADNAAKSENAAAQSAKASADSATAAAQSATASAQSATDAQTILEEIRSDAGNLATKQDLTELREVVDGKSAILVQDSISTLLSYFSSLAADVYPAGRMNVYLREDGVPDFWISAILPSPIDTPSYGTYRNGAFHVAGKWLPRMEYYEYPDYAVGYYVLTKLETGKIRIPITEWDLVITGKGELGLLETASGNVLVKGVDIIQSLSVSSSVSLLQFADCHFPMDSEQRITISGTAGTTIRGVLLDGNDSSTSLTISGFGFVEHCYGLYPVQLYLTNCSNIFHCSFSGATACHTISDCRVDNDYEGVLFENCQYISNIHGASFGGNDVDFNGCAYLSNIYIADANYENCTYVDVHTCYGYIDTPNILYGTDGYGEQTKVDINAELDKKLDKATVAPSADSAYVEKKGGGQGLIAIISDDSEPETIVQRNANGQIVTADPTESNHAATRGFVEEQVQAAGIIPRYGVRFGGGSNTGSTVARLYNAVGLVAGVGTDAATADNDFDNIYPWSARRRCCGVWDADGNFIVNAYKGEPGYTEDGSNGEVWVEHSLFYFKHIYDGEAEEIAISATPLAGYAPAPIFQSNNGEGAPYQKAYTAAFPMATVGGKATSRAGVFSEIYSLNTGMTEARKLGGNYTVTTTAEWYTECLYMWVEFATRNLQSVMNGASNMPYSATYKAIVAEENTNRVVITTAQANNFVVGQTIGVGTSLGSINIANNRIVTAIEAYDGTNSAVVFDGDPVKIAVGNIIFALAWINGSCNSVLSSSGSPVSNTNGKYNCVYRGKETPYGNSFECIADVLLNREGEGTAESPYTYDPYFLPDPTKYANGSITDDYVKMNYSVPGADGYAKTLGKDDRFPWVRMPSAIGAASTTYYADYYYYPRSALCAARVGGHWYAGSYDGPCFWYCYNTPSHSSVDYRARLSYHRK